MGTPETGRVQHGRGAVSVDEADLTAAQRERELALLEEAAQLLASARSLVDIYPVMVRAAALIVATTQRHWRASYLALEGDRLRRVALHDEAGIDLAAQDYPLAEYPALRRVVESGQQLAGDATILSAGIPDDIAARVEREGLAHAILIPVAHAGEVFGVLGLSSRDIDVEQDVPVQRLGAIAHLSALAIANARHFAEQRRVAEQARAVEHAKTRFLNLAAHELRGPVTVLRGYLSMLAEGSIEPLSEPIGTVVDMLLTKVGQMNRMIEDMLESARLEEGRLELDSRRLDLCHVISDAVSVMAPLVGAGRLTVEVGDHPIQVRGDRDRLTTVVTNLIDNAAKYSAPGTAIEVRCGRTGHLAAVSVTDRGFGLSAADQAVLFTRFGRIASPLTSHIPGTGLGLWLCREIARLHGGDIDVESTEGEGSTFTLVLPVDGAKGAIGG